MLPRALVRKVYSPRWNWPKALRNKWPAITLFVGVLFAYELFDLFADPWWTGVLIVSYFGLATAVDSLFRQASFCKYVCPIGQFNFLASTLSPLEVVVRDPSVCTECKTKDCIRGRRDIQNELTSIGATQQISGTVGSNRAKLPIVQRGCELALFQPRKTGNLDCTFCMDCVYACPADNVGIIARLPGEELGQIGSRSGLGVLERRLDFSVLAVVFAFGALLNAFAMISPVYTLERAIANATGLRVEWPILAAIFSLFLVIEPAILLLSAAVITKRLTGSNDSAIAIVKRLAPSLLPIGFGVWLAHYAFHFLTGALTIIPVSQNAVRQAFGTAWLGKPQWSLGGMPESMVYAIELGFLLMGFIGSVATAWMILHRIQQGFASKGPDRASLQSSVAKATVPWGVLYFLMLVSAIWIMNQPMDMRGTFLGG
ncbi:hypothetical protein LOC67_01190 [Stieleria sp. JC731]|uniref:hypothetical protein n=1 Tax=Pirellulaceae TaxID=2691357 RepID=UPI001E5464E7|nr:hypothetical protein [Stieleria sp. JC731]MCC9599156.1 hypothetical protein [Stieleria sp. JC731]